MFRRKNGNTSVGTIERTYKIQLNARSDMLLDTLLGERGFDSLTQLLKAYRGNLFKHPTRRRVFLSFHAEDLSKIRGFRLMVSNPNVRIDLEDKSLLNAVRSSNESYVRQSIHEKIRAAEVVACLIGHGTAWREWVDWEIETALRLKKGVCGIMLKGSRGRHPLALKEVGAPIASWNTNSMTAAIEMAAARRS